MAHALHFHHPTRPPLPFPDAPPHRPPHLDKTPLVLRAVHDQYPRRDLAEIVLLSPIFLLVPRPPHLVRGQPGRGCRVEDLREDGHVLFGIGEVARLEPGDQPGAEFVVRLRGIGLPAGVDVGEEFGLGGGALVDEEVGRDED